MRKLMLILVVVLLAGCAEASLGPETDMGSDDSPPNNVNNTNNTNNTNNQTVNNTNNTDPCPLCCAGDKVCVAAGTVGTCRADGRGFQDTICENGQVCDEGACVDPSTCNAGERSCFDQNTVLICRQSQDGFVSMPCDAGQTCYLGQCLSGDSLGAACSADESCVTQNCHCGSGTDESCPASISNGYCTSETCDATSCGRDAICLASTVVPLGGGADYNHCVPRCVGSCASGFECLSLPSITEAGTAWEAGCYFSGFADIGETCSSNAQCIGGECLTDVFNTKYCSRRCTDDGECPVDSVCANLRSDGQFWCTLKCGDGGVTGTAKCPLDLPTERFDVTCKLLSTVDGGVSRACAASN